MNKEKLSHIPKESLQMRLINKVATVLETYQKKNPQSAYAAVMERFQAIASKQPEEIKQDVGFKWLKFDAVKEAVGAEVGGRIADIFINAAVWPVVVLRGKFMSPIYSANIAKAKMPDMIGATTSTSLQTKTGIVNLNITPQGFGHIT